MALNKFMHPRNLYKNKKSDFRGLAIKYPEFRKHVFQDLAGKVYLDFKNPASLRQLSITLMQEDFGLSVELPLDRLIPTIPLRLNYIHWVEDILQRKTGPSVKGIDIGTGASCVYPLLAHQINKWTFLATETDEENLVFAKKNIAKNNLEGTIKLVKVTDNMILNTVITADDTTYDFCMCNPPFFADHLEAMALTKTRSDDRPEPRSVCTASPTESIVEGGEVDFIKKMIHESLELKSKVRVYTSMVGKKTSLPQIREELRRLQIPKYSTMEFCQGKTMRWGIAWTFDTSISFPTSLFQESKKKKVPLVYDVPTDALDTYSVDAVKQKVLQLLQELKIQYEEMTAVSKGDVTLSLTAVENTWSHQRRRRRERKLKERQKDEVSSAKGRPEEEEENVHREEEYAAPMDQERDPVLQKINIQVSHVANKQTENQHKEELASKEPCEQPNSVANKNVNKISCAQQKSSDNESDISNSKIVSGTESRKRKSSSEPEHSQEIKIAKKDKVMIPVRGKDLEEAQVSSDRILLKEPDVSTSSENCLEESIHGDIYQKEEFLFKSTLNIKRVRKIYLEMTWQDGANRESMHQVMQFLKNQLKSHNNNVLKDEKK